MPLPSQALPSQTQKQARQQSSTAANSMSSQLQNYVCRETLVFFFNFELSLLGPEAACRLFPPLRSDIHLKHRRHRPSDRSVGLPRCRARSSFC
jgi:hypothetical protein